MNKTITWVIAAIIVYLFVIWLRWDIYGIQSWEKAQVLLQQERYEEALKKLHNAAERGHAAAQNVLGNCYADGKGVSQDDTETVKWYRKAAEQGHARAQYMLGLLYEFGRGVPKDLKKAEKWYIKTAAQDDEDAIKRLRELNVR